MKSKDSSKQPTLETKAATQAQKTLLVTLFFGLPGLGKTTLFDSFQKIKDETNIGVQYISEDDM